MRVFIIAEIIQEYMKTVSIGDTHGKAIADVVLKIINEHDKLFLWATMSTRR